MVTLDTKTSRSEARAGLEAAPAPLGRVASVQGNLDVAVLKRGASTPEQVGEEARRSVPLLIIPTRRKMSSPRRFHTV